MLLSFVPELITPDREAHKTSVQDSAPPDSQDGDDVDDTFWDAGGLWNSLLALISFDEPLGS